MLDNIPPFLRDLYVARHRALVTEAEAIAKALGLAPRYTAAQWERRQTETPGEAMVNRVLDLIGEEPIPGTRQAPPPPPPPPPPVKVGAGWSGLRKPRGA